MILFYLIVCMFNGVFGDYSAYGKSIPYDAQILNITNDDVHTWSSPVPYLTGGNQQLVVTAREGFTILITVKNVDIDGENGDFLLIKSGTSLDDGHTGRIFTHILRSERTYISYINEAFLSFEVYGENAAGHHGFVVTIERFGEPVTTEFPPTTEVTWPTPEDEEKPIHLTVNITGRYPNDYRNESVRMSFQEAVASMATEYCAINFNLSEEITYANVHLDRLVQCPINWPRRERCVQIRFSLPIILAEDSDEGYQLTTHHLEIMWARFASKYLSVYEDIYEPPNAGETLKLWVIIMCVVLIAFVILLYVIRVCGIRWEFNTDKTRRLSEAAEVTEQKGEQVSRASLGPHPLQSVPELFEYEYPVYEPDVTPMHLDDMDDSDDDVSDLVMKNFSKETEA